MTFCHHILKESGKVAMSVFAFCVVTLDSQEQDISLEEVGPYL